NARKATGFTCKWNARRESNASAAGSTPRTSATPVSPPSACRAPTPFTRSSMLDSRLKAYATAAVVLTLDRLSKWIVESNVSFMDTVPVIPGLFNIVRSENRGMAFGILNDSTSVWPTTLLIVLSAAAVGFVAGLLWNRQGLGRSSFLG